MARGRPTTSTSMDAGTPSATGSTPSSGNPLDPYPPNLRQISNPGGTKEHAELNVFVARPTNWELKPEFDCGVSIDSLKALEPKIRELAKDPSKWRTLLVDYHPPTVERVWTEIDGFRVHIHVIHRTDEPCLLHKHRWPSAMKQLAGIYEMGLSYMPTEPNGGAMKPSDLPLLSRLELPAGSYYEMRQTDALHYVRPLTPMTMSLMVTRDLFPEGQIRREADHPPLGPLTEARAKVILEKAIELLS